jgi:hypothetical protein
MTPQHNTTMNTGTRLATLLFVLQSTLTQAQIIPGAKAPGPKASGAVVGTPATVNYSRHKITDYCTTAPRSEWIDESEMKLLVLHRGYRIKTFKVSKTNCYEVYGFDKENRVVEAYFDPITTRLFLQNIAQ